MTEEQAKEQLLFCSIAGIHLAASFAYVKEVILLGQSILSVPGVPRQVRGIINFRGNILAIIDLLQILDHPAPDHVYRNILVLHKNEVDAGLLVDDVPRIGSVLPEEIKELSDFTHKDLGGAVSREVYYEGRCYGVLDISKILDLKAFNENKI